MHPRVVTTSHHYWGHYIKIELCVISVFSSVTKKTIITETNTYLCKYYWRPLIIHIPSMKFESKFKWALPLCNPQQKPPIERGPNTKGHLVFFRDHGTAEVEWPMCKVNFNIFSLPQNLMRGVLIKLYCGNKSDKLFLNKKIYIINS